MRVPRDQNFTIAEDQRVTSLERTPKTRWSSARKSVICFCVILTINSANPSSCPAAPDLSDEATAVEAGGDALRGQWGSPWYDRSADDYKPLDLPPPKARKPSKFWQAIGDWLGSWDFDLAGFFEVLMWLVLAAMIGIALYVLYKAVQNVEMREIETSESEELARSHIERVEALPVTIDNPITDFYAETRRLRGQRDYAGAMVYLFGHQLIELDRRHLIRLVKGKTNRQYLRELRRNTGGQTALPEIVRETTLLFERSFFGAQPPSESEFEHVWNRMQEFESLTAATAKEAA